MLPQVAFAAVLLVVGFGAHVLRRSLAGDPLPDVRAENPAASAAVPAPMAPASARLDGASAAPAPGDVPATAMVPVARPPRGSASAAPAGRGGAAIAGGRAPTAPADASGEPEVANVLAREALRLVGKDPQALVIWKRAINDPALPAGDRSDLIEDLNDEGYDDQGAFTESDLRLILARLELIEHEMPLAMDATNAWAFTEAYQDLLGMLAKARTDVAARSARR